MPKATITIEVKDIFQQKKLESLFSKLAQLPADDIDRITQVVDHPKGLPALKKYWATLKKFA